MVEERYALPCQNKYYLVSYQSESIHKTPESKRTISWECMLNHQFDQPDDLYDKIITKANTDNYISFGAEKPSPEAIPLDTIRKLINKASEEINIDILGSTPTQGLLSLRQSLCRLLKKRNIHVSPANIQIFSETTQTVRYLFQLFVAPGDSVLLEEPFYPDIKIMLRDVMANVVTIPTDENGIITDFLEDLILHHKPKMIYLIPTFNNPARTVLPLDRRYKVIELCTKYGIPLIEEDSIYDIRFRGEPIPPIKSLDKSSHVIYMDSFFFTLAPGIRISYAVASKPVIEKFKYLLVRDGLQIDTVSQLILSNYLDEGYYDQVLEMIKCLYSKKQKAMEEELLKGLDIGISFVTPPGDVGFWIKLPDWADATHLLKKTTQQGVLFMPGSVFFPDKYNQGNYIRMTYSYASIEEIRIGIPIILNCLREMRPS